MKSEIIILIVSLIYSTIFSGCISFKDLPNQDLYGLKKNNLGSNLGYYSNYPDSATLIGRKGKLESYSSNLNCLSNILTNQDTCTNKYSQFSIELVSEDSLVFRFYSKNDTLLQPINGELKDGFFEFYIRKYRKGLPFIYYKSAINKIRIGTNDSTLLIDQYRRFFGMIFIINAGDAYQRQFYYKKAPNKS